MINEGRPFFITIGSLIVLTLSTNAVGAEWTFTKGINAGAVYTDNVNLVSSGEESDISAVLTPHFSLHGKGARANVDITGAIELNNQDDGSNDSVNPRLQADAKAELVERLAFIDLNATATQNAIDPLDVAATNNLSNRGNTTTTYRYKISPYLKNRFKGLAETELRYTYNELIHSEGSVSDSSSEAINLSIDRGMTLPERSGGLTLITAGPTVSKARLAN